MVEIAARIVTKITAKITGVNGPLGFWYSKQKPPPKSHIPVQCTCNLCFSTSKWVPKPTGIQTVVWFLVLAGAEGWLVFQLIVICSLSTTAHFNKCFIVQITFWVIKEILNEERTKVRAAVLSHFIKIAKVSLLFWYFPSNCVNDTFNILDCAIKESLPQKCNCVSIFLDVLFYVINAWYAKRDC